MEEAISFAKDNGFQDVIFQSDSLSIIQALNGIIILLASVAHIIDGSLQGLRSFRQVQVVYVPRLGNKAAHGLAQYARNIYNFFTWIEEMQCITKRSLALDVLCLSLSE